MILNLIFGCIAVLSLALTLWQWLVARRFPLHQRIAVQPSPSLAPSPHPPVTLLKPLKGCDSATEACLRSWFAQQYTGPVQILLGVASANDPVCGIVRQLVAEFPTRDAQLVVGTSVAGANAKVAKLAELERLAKHDILIISDADVRVPPDCLANVVHPLSEVPLAAPATNASTARPCGLVCCFYRLANPASLAMQWEVVAINADFWSQVLQARSLKPIDFALGAVMATRRQQLQEIGGFIALVNCLADDYQLGNRIARRGYPIALSTIVVECWAAPMSWVAVWKHQLRWARTIRVCQPVLYFFSILSNATLWPVLWLALTPVAPVAAFAVACCLVRILTALNLQHRLHQDPVPAERASSPALWRYAWLAPVKDLLQAAIWLLAFLGNHVEWRGERMRLRRDGTLVRSPYGTPGDASKARILDPARSRLT